MSVNINHSTNDISTNTGGVPTLGGGAPAIQTSGTSSGTPTAGSGTFTSATYTVNWKRVGNIIFIAANVHITTNGTATGAVIFPLPANPIICSVGAGRENSTTGYILQCFFNTNGSAYISGYNNSYPGGDGYDIWVSGFYFV